MKKTTKEDEPRPQKQSAVAAFERARKCEALPAGEVENVEQGIARAKYRLKEGQDALDMPDMSNCVIA